MPETKSRKDEQIKITAGKTKLEAEHLKVEDSDKCILICSLSHHENSKDNCNTLSEFITGKGISVFSLILVAENEDITEKNRQNNKNEIEKRLKDIVRYLQEKENYSNVGVFSYGDIGGSVLSLAANEEIKIASIVLASGNPEEAEDDLKKLSAPVMMIVGGNDYKKVSVNRNALDVMTNEKRLEIIPGSGREYEDKGMISEVARITSEWFERYL